MFAMTIIPASRKITLKSTTSFENASACVMRPTAITITAARSSGVMRALCVTRRGAARDAAREDAAAQEGALERAIAVHPAAAEAARLARRVQTAHRRAVRAQHPTVEIGLEPAERLAREDPQADGHEWPALRIEERVRTRDTDEAVAE